MATAKPANWPSSVIPKAIGSGQPVRVAMKGMFCKASSWRNRNGPIASQGYAFGLETSAAGACALVAPRKLLSAIH